MSGGRVFVDISMSLDGFITGPKDSVELPLGEGGDRLHRWLYDLGSWRELHGPLAARPTAMPRSSRRRSNGPGRW
jgi:hypothetical protein